jgi:hypothetical protein
VTIQDFERLESLHHVVDDIAVDKLMHTRHLGGCNLQRFWWCFDGDVVTASQQRSQEISMRIGDDGRYLCGKKKMFSREVRKVQTKGICKKPCLDESGSSV